MLVDAVGHRVEVIAETTLPAEPLRAPELSGEALAAAQRYDARLARVGTRTVVREGREVREVALATLSEGELAAHFDDATKLSNIARGETVRTQLRGVGGRAPSMTQEAAIISLEATAMTDVGVLWDELRGSPRGIGGAMYVRRDGSPVDVGREWIETMWPELADALGTDRHDELEFAGTAGLPSEVELVYYRRTRAGLPMSENFIEVHVTKELHPIGRGVVLHVETQWDTDVADGGSTTLDRAAAVERASALLGRPIRPEGLSVELGWRCFHGLGHEGAACRPTWDVRDEAPSREGLGTLDDHDSATLHLDARTGALLGRGPRDQHYEGHVAQTSRYPFESTDVQRDMQHAELRQFCIFGFCNSSTDGNGEYDFTPPFGAAAQVGLKSPSGRWARFYHGHLPQCGAFNPDYQWQNIQLDVGASIVMPPSATTQQRGDWMLFHYFNYFADTAQSIFGNLIDYPEVTWFDAGPGAGGSFRDCSDGPSTGVIGVGADTDTTSGVAIRDVFWEEAFHATEWCMQTVGVGCGWTNVPPRSPLGASFGHAAGGAIAARMEQYGSWIRGASASNHLRYDGIAVVGDIMIHDAEIQGTPTFGAQGCNPDSGSGGTYNCASNEACFVGAMDRPRCMRRAPGANDCATFFPNQPVGFVDRRQYGSSPTETSVWICVSNDYTNGRLWLHLGEHLINSGGHFAGVGGLYRANNANTRTRQLTQGADTYHRAVAAWSGSYEASNAFHKVSTEIFPWLDDTTNVWWRSEVIRTPRTGTLTFTNGGPTGSPLAFGDGLVPSGLVFDGDSFLLAVDPGETYEIIATTASSAVDLCVDVWNHITEQYLPQLPTHPDGCTNGASTAAARNHTYRFNSGTANRVDLHVQNLLANPGIYQLQIRNVADDYADQLSHHFTSHPILSGSPATAGTLETTSDRDLFRYDAPPGTSGTLTFSTTGAAAGATLQVYAVAAPAAPGGAPIATGVGAVNVAVTGGLSYYALVIAGTTTGAYTLTATHSGCGLCNGNGTYTTPLPLPSTSGGMVVNRLDRSATAPGFDTWAACDAGTACDWYAVTLAANERLTLTTYDIFDGLCDVEASIFAPHELEYWRVPAGIRMPMTYDLNGSMETFGSQLTFVAPRAGTYRIRVRALELDCPRYRMTAARGATDRWTPLTPH